MHPKNSPSIKSLWQKNSATVAHTVIRKDREQKSRNMKKISIVQEFEHPLATLLRAREERYKHLDKFPELKNVEIIEEHTEGDTLKQTRKIHLGSSLPAVLVPLLPSGADTLVETSTFDHKTNEHDFVVVPDGGHGDIFTITGKSRYYERGEGGSARNYEIEIQSKAFLVGSVVETAIGEIYSQNVKKDQNSIEHFIELLKEEEGSKGAPEREDSDG